MRLENLPISQLRKYCKYNILLSYSQALVKYVNPVVVIQSNICQICLNYIKKVQ